MRTKGKVILICIAWLFLCIQPTYAKNTEKIDIAFAGDTLMGDKLKKLMKAKTANPFKYVAKEVSSSDYAVLNLETAVTTKTIPYPDKQYNFKADVSLLTKIKESGFDLVSLANNHTMDYGRAGLFDTFANIKASKLVYIGAGRNEAESYAAKTVKVKGKTIKIIAFSNVLPTPDWYATSNKSGISNGYNQSKVVAAIKKAHIGADYVFVYIHWGTEKVNRPDADEKAYARKMIDAGADAIIGSHPHVLQGFEYYKGRPIAYSLGNFLFPEYVKGSTAQTGILHITCQDKKVTMRFSSYVINNNQILPLSKVERQKMFSYLQSISYRVSVKELGISAR